MLQRAHSYIQQQADEADDDHAGDDEIVAIAGVTRVDDQKAEAGVYGDHFRCDDDQPADTEGDPHADDQLRNDRGKENTGDEGC